MAGDKGVLGLDGVAQRKAGVKVDTFSRVVGEQLRAHAEYTAPRSGEEDDDSEEVLLADRVGSVTPDGGASREKARASKAGVESPPPGPPPAAPAENRRSAQVEQMKAAAPSTAAPADEATEVAQERRGSFLVRSSLSRQVALDLSDLARTTYADPNEVEAMFPKAKPAD